MSKIISVYLTIGKPGEAVALCRLDNPNDSLVRTIAQHVLAGLFQEARQLENQEKNELARIKLKNAWLLRSTLEGILPDLKLDENGSPVRKKPIDGNLLQPRNAGRRKKTQR